LFKCWVRQFYLRRKRQLQNGRKFHILGLVICIAYLVNFIWVNGDRTVRWVENVARWGKERCI